MRPHRLVLEGFGPFRDRQTVDFDAVARDGIFLITGPTGAGKTTILDGLCFALFNTVPGPRGSAADLRSHLTAPGDPTRVELEFSVGDRRFRIERSPQYQRPRKRGTGMTTQNHTVALLELVDGQWAGIARTAQETQAFLDAVIGLTAAQFTKLVVLPQGDFSAFLHADPAERESILEKLFATQHFRAVERVLGERATHARRATEEGEHQRRFALEAAAQAAWERLPDAPARPSIADTIAHLGLAAVSAQERAAVADTTQALWEEHADEAATAARDWEARSEDRAVLTALLADQDAWERDAPVRAQLDAQVRRARAAHGLRHLLRARTHAQEATARREEERATAHAAVQTALPTGAALAVEELDDAQLAAVVAHLERSVERLSRLADLEQDVRTAQDAAAAARQALEDAQTAQRRREDDATTLRQRIRQQREESESLHDAAAQREALRERRRLLAERETARAQHEAADARVLSDAQAAQTTAQRLTTLRAALRADAAARLAADLQQGQPCPVCGSCEHPRPAHPVPDGPTPEEVEEAEAADLRAREALAGARAGLDSAAAVLRAAQDAAGDDDGEDLPALLQAAEDAVQRRAALRETLIEDERRLEALEAGLAEARREESRLLEARTQADTAATAARSTLAEARQSQADDAPTALAGVGLTPPSDVRAARSAAATATALRTAHTSWTRARDAARSAQQDLRAREDELTAALAESEFADAPALEEAARLPLDRLEEQQEAHRAQATRLALRRDTEQVRRARADTATHDELRDATARAQDRAAGLHAQADGARQRALLAHDRSATAHAALDRARRQRGADEERQDELARDIDVAELVLGTSNEAASRMSLSSFALAALFEEVAAHATDRLVDMTAGRYRLLHDLERRRGERRAGLGLKILDTFTDEARDPRTLSGGESFMAALALALGLADTVRSETGGIDLDALFLDEGFGTLDADTLGDVLAVLDRLRTGGRTVGIISHVSELQQAIPTRIAVEPGPRGATIRSGRTPDDSTD